MKKMGFGVLFASVLAMSACGEPRIDASSEEAMKESIAKIKASLPESEREAFGNSAVLVAMNGTDVLKMAAAEASGTGDLMADMRARLDGKTVAEVMAQAEQIKAERAAREAERQAAEEARKREQALGEIAELEAAKLKAEAGKAELAKFGVLKSRYSLSESGWTKQGLIELTVQNGTGQAVSRAYFKGTLASPDRSVPWAVGDFNYSIPGGLEPGEKASWRLSPNMMSEFYKAEVPEGAVFTVEVIELDGADGESFASVKGFDDRDDERLATLKASYSPSEG